MSKAASADHIGEVYAVEIYKRAFVFITLTWPLAAVHTELIDGQQANSELSLLCLRVGGLLCFCAPLSNLTIQLTLECCRYICYKRHLHRRPKTQREIEAKTKLSMKLAVEGECQRICDSETALWSNRARKNAWEENKGTGFVVA